MRKKGQAAMEFLMTYGWAIIVVLAAIAALAYFGVLSPSKLLPERTTFAAPLSNVDNAVIDSETSSVSIAFMNNLGVEIDLTGTDGAMIIDGATCDLANYELTSNKLTVPNGESFIINWTMSGEDGCWPATAEPGDKFKGEALSFSYINSETGQTKKQTGTVDGKFQ